MQTIIIRDVQLAYPKLSKAQANQFGAVQYDVRIDFPAARMAELQQFSRQPARASDEQGMLSINVRAPEFNAKGKSNKPIVIDMKGEALNETEIMEMGNGTKANVKVFQYISKKDGKMSTILKAIQVIEYKKYELDSIDFDIVDSKPTNPSVDF